MADDPRAMAAAMDQAIKQPRTITPERARELRKKLPELLPKIDAVLAEYPEHYGRKN